MIDSLIIYQAGMKGNNNLMGGVICIRNGLNLATQAIGFNINCPLIYFGIDPNIM
jgi:hypothetical protein